MLTNKEALLEEYKNIYWEQKRVNSKVNLVRAFKLDKLIEDNSLTDEVSRFEEEAWSEYEYIIDNLSSRLFDLMVQAQCEMLSANKEELSNIREELRKYDNMGYIRARAISKLKELESFKQLPPEVQIEVCVRWCTL